MQSMTSIQSMLRGPKIVQGFERIAIFLKYKEVLLMKFLKLQVTPNLKYDVPVYVVKTASKSNLKSNT